MVFVEQELSQLGCAVLHLAEGGDLLRQFALALVLLVQVLAGQVVGQLENERRKKSSVNCDLMSLRIVRGGLTW